MNKSQTDLKDLLQSDPWNGSIRRFIREVDEFICSGLEDLHRVNPSLADAANNSFQAATSSFRITIDVLKGGTMCSVNRHDHEGSIQHLFTFDKVDDPDANSGLLTE